MMLHALKHCKSFSKTMFWVFSWHEWQIKETQYLFISFPLKHLNQLQNILEERNARAPHGNSAISRSCPEQNAKSPSSGASVSKHLFSFCLLSQLLLIKQWKPFTFHILFNTLFFISCPWATSTEVHSGSLSTMGGQSFALLLAVWL